MVTVVGLVTTVVVMLNVVDVREPAATVTVAGTDATVGLELDSATVTPPIGAGPFKVTVFPVIVFPPTVPGCARLTEETARGITVSVTGTEMPLYLAVMVTGVFTVTGVVTTLNADDVVAPADTVTVGVTTATVGLLLERYTVAPAGGAGASRVTVLVAVPSPPTKVAAARFTEATLSGVTVRVATAFTPYNVAVMVTGVLTVT